MIQVPRGCRVFRMFVIKTVVYVKVEWRWPRKNEARIKREKKYKNGKRAVVTRKGKTNRERTGSRTGNNTRNSNEQ